eukprot:CAMPEP_0181230592 /NCGR_PEP_ID=MMETSP1096-20121128/34571_1 /TAXON_ID=156174 ORGANISM="Chrysochromulina ericina, Strain CCMP281" /NCGR_SAMPLE_ID=MMETSP1096 /ASSEMBLY_ACC=CAM_ASM_000453 /LENGTH=89 /DNA_ID=CAMNT_0023324409 /DNA_START=187 /DNA_END=453 /DNA_ORIENTATION=-
MGQTYSAYNLRRASKTTRTPPTPLAITAPWCRDPNGTLTSSSRRDSSMRHQMHGGGAAPPLALWRVPAARNAILAQAGRCGRGEAMNRT